MRDILLCTTPHTRYSICNVVRRYKSTVEVTFTVVLSSDLEKKYYKSDATEALAPKVTVCGDFRLSVPDKRWTRDVLELKRR